MPGQAMAVVEQIKSHLAGQGPAVQGAALADLLAIWLAGHPPEMRDRLLDMHIAKVRELIPVNAVIAFASFSAHRGSPGLFAQMASAPELFEVVKAQHEAIDRLFAMLVSKSAAVGPRFFPSKCGQPWEAAVAGSALIKRLGG